MLRKMLRASNSIAHSLPLLLLVAPIFTLAAHAADKAPAQHHVSHRKAHKKVPPLVLPPLPAGPLAQIPMDQLPAAAPKVTYENGMLTIAAQNATLGEILRDVRKLTGATIDIPPSGANERVVVQLGPGAPRDVLAALLNGSSFNYVMLGSATDPGAVATVLLTSRAGGEVQTAVNTASETPTPFQQQPQVPVAGRAFPPNFRGPAFQRVPVPPPSADADDADDSDSDADDKDDDSDQAQPQQVQPIQPNLGQQSDNEDDGNPPNAGPKTPEQILQMIRQGQRPLPPGMPPQQQQQPPDE
ncbi:MAG: hypothetical protein WA213_03695 [Terriglobales bacterium]